MCSLNPSMEPNQSNGHFKLLADKIRLELCSIKFISVHFRNQIRSPRRNSDHFFLLASGYKANNRLLSPVNYYTIKLLHIILLTYN